MKRLLCILSLGIAFFSSSITPVFAARVVKDIPLNACIFLDRNDLKVAAYVIGARERCQTAGHAPAGLRAYGQEHERAGGLLGRSGQLDLQ